MYKANTSIKLSNFSTNLLLIISAGENYWLLLLDGHTSHVNWEFFDLCLHKRIFPFCLPAHSTHLLQPLNVGLFAAL